MKNFYKSWKQVSERNRFGPLRILFAGNPFLKNLIKFPFWYKFLFKIRNWFWSLLWQVRQVWHWLFSLPFVFIFDLDQISTISRKRTWRRHLSTQTVSYPKFILIFCSGSRFPLKYLRISMREVSAILKNDSIKTEIELTFNSNSSSKAFKWCQIKFEKIFYPWKSP